MTQNVKMMVLNEKVVDHAFHKYVNPIPEFNSWQQLPEHIDVMPLAVTQNSGPITLTVKGKGVLAGPLCLIEWQGVGDVFVIGAATNPFRLKIALHRMSVMDPKADSSGQRAMSA
jgi:hypothetical protein